MTLSPATPVRAQSLVERLRKYVRACEITGNGNSETCAMVKQSADRIETLEAELALLDEVCARYADDEDRTIRGHSEPFGTISTECGLKARAARKRFRDREAALPTSPETQGRERG